MRKAAWIFAVAAATLWLSPALALERVPWTESRLQGSPEPPKPFATERLDEAGEWAKAVEMIASPRGGQEVIVVELAGTYSRLDLHRPGQRETMIDLKQLHPEMNNAFGIAFHPEFPQREEVFLSYAFKPKIDDGSRLSRFRIDPETLTIDPASEEVLLTWRSGGHNGASIRFGPDGMLYLSTGDSEVPSPPDPLHTGQDNSDLLSCILRLDVDGPPDAGKAYAVPPDNPFVGREGYQPEIWAYGFRNPWKIAFGADGRLWCGDVGWELWEMVHLVPKGGNHGWAAVEASQLVYPEDATTDPIIPPVDAYPHTVGASVTGGFVYRGSRFPELKDGYVYGDYETGKVWAIWHDGEKVSKRLEVADTPLKIVSFGEDPEGELYLIDFGDQGSIHRLIRNPAHGEDSASRFPTRLSETGLFRHTGKQRPSPGVYPFTVRYPAWDDGATAERWVALPGESKVETAPRGRLRQRLTWPKDTVFARTLSLPAADGEPARRVETQVIHFNGLGWNGYSYLWNEEGTDAELAPAEGLALEVDPPGGSKTRLWTVQGRGECLRCHSDWNGYALGFQAEQLDQIQVDRQWVSAREAIDLGLYDAMFLDRTEARVARKSDPMATTEDRARAYLHTNCSTCHRQGGGGSVTIFLEAESTLEELASIDVVPLRGGLGVDPSRIIAPGSPQRSVLIHRMARMGAGHMPMAGPREVDAEGLAVLWDWIAEMPEGAQPTIPSQRIEKDRRKLDALLSAEPGVELLEAADLVSVLGLAHRCADPDWPPAQAWIEAGLRLHDTAKAALFERFRDPSERSVTVGLEPDPLPLLALSGDPARGRELLTPTGALAACLACHRSAEGEGLAFGPDLFALQGQRSREQLLTALLKPSAELTEGFATVSVTLADGTVHTGIQVAKDQGELQLRIAGGVEIRLKVDEIRETRSLPTSLMPPGLIQHLTFQQVADLLAWLERGEG